MRPPRYRFVLPMLCTVLLFLLWFDGPNLANTNDPKRGTTPNRNALVSPSENKDQKIVPIAQFTQQDIGDVFTIISDITGWSIFPSTDVSKTKVSLWASDIPAEELLDRVIKLSGFVYEREKDTISVMTPEEYTRLYGVDKSIITLKYANAVSVAKAVEPFLTKLGRVVVHKETSTVVLYEVPANLPTLVQVAQALDVPTEDIEAKVVDLKYANCETLAKLLNSLFSPPDKLETNRSQHDTKLVQESSADPTLNNDNTESVVAYDHVGVHAVTHANQLVIVGTQTDIKRIYDLVEKMDIAGDSMVIKVLRLEYADAETVASTLRDMFPSQKDGDNRPVTRENNLRAPRQQPSPATSSSNDLMVSLQSHVDVQAVGRTNQIVVKAVKGVIEKVQALVTELDVFIEPLTQNYHFSYVDAAQVYVGLERILYAYGSQGSSPRSSGGSGRISPSSGSSGSGVTLVERTNSIVLTGPPSAHRIMTSICESVDVPGTYEAGLIKVYRIQNASVDEIAETVRSLIENTEEDSEGRIQSRFLGNGNQGGGEAAATEEFVPQVKAKVSVNKATNSIIVQATARQHLELDQLIKELDIRRKQVLIEALIVEIANTDNLDLGVELDYIDLVKNTALFSQFGLSTFDPTTGTRTGYGGTGGNAAVLSPGKVQAIIRALQATDDIRIQSAPQVLVNDNEAGEINNISQEPTRQTNVNNTVTTTAFSEYVDAGTRFSITPHISDYDYLHVDYNIELSSFGEKADDTLPPSKTTSTLSGRTTVPDGHTIIVGGIQTTRESESVDKVPLLGDIPLLGAAFRNTAKRKQIIRTYLFISTTIMKQDDFQDLKDASEGTMQEAEISDLQYRKSDSNPKKSSTSQQEHVSAPISRAWPTYCTHLIPSGGIHPSP